MSVTRNCRSIDAWRRRGQAAHRGRHSLPELGAEQRLRGAEHAIEAAQQRWPVRPQRADGGVDRSRLGLIGYHAVLHHREMGYSNLYWYRGGRTLARRRFAAGGRRPVRR